MTTEVSTDILRESTPLGVTLQTLRKIPRWCYFLLFGILAIYGHSLLAIGNFKGIVYAVYSVVTLVALIYGIRRKDHQTFGPWQILALGFGLNVLADTAYYYCKLFEISLPYPSLIDGVYLSGYVIRSIAIHAMNQARTRHQDLSGWIDSLIIGCGAGLLSWIFLMEPYADNTAMTFLERAVSIAYPLMDVLMLAMVARMWISPGKRPPAYFLLSAGLSLWMIADTIYAKAILDGVYYNGHLLDAGWLLSSTLLATAALHPSMRQMVEQGPQIEIRMSWQRLTLLATMSLLSPATLVIQTLRNIPLNVGVVAGGSALLYFLILIRMSGLMEQLGRAVAREQTLRNASATFVATPYREGIYAAALKAIGRLADDRITNITLILGLPDEAQQVASLQNQQEIVHPTPIPLDVLPKTILEQLRKGTMKSYGQHDYPKLWESLSLDSSCTEMVVVPVSVQQRLLATVMIGVKRRLPSEVRGSIEALSAQIALALESLTLTENLHKQRSEARFRSLVQHGSDIITIVDAHGGIRYVSPAIERLLGYEPETILGTNLAQRLIHPSNFNAIENSMKC